MQTKFIVRYSQLSSKAKAIIFSLRFVIRRCSYRTWVRRTGHVSGTVHQLGSRG